MIVSASRALIARSSSTGGTVCTARDTAARASHRVGRVAGAAAGCQRGQRGLAAGAASVESGGTSGTGEMAGLAVSVGIWIVASVTDAGVCA